MHSVILSAGVFLIAPFGVTGLSTTGDSDEQVECMGVDIGGEEDEASSWSNLGAVPGLRRLELGWYLAENVGWDETKVVGEIDDVVIYQSINTFPSLGFINDGGMKEARYHETLSGMRVSQLKNMCRDMGLKVSGKKVELIQQILGGKPGIQGVIYVDKKERVGQKKWKPTRRILLVHDDTEEVNQVSGGKLPYGRADIAFLRDLVMHCPGKRGTGFLNNPGFMEPLVCYDIRQLPTLLKAHRYDLVLISSHGGKDGLSGKGRSISKDNLITALKEGKGVGYLFISSCDQANSWSRHFEEDLGEGYWDEWYEEDDFSTAIISECPVRCLTVSGLKVGGGPESSLFIVSMLMEIMQGRTFSKTLSNIMKKHPEEGYHDIPLFFTHAGDPTFQISSD